MLAQAREYFPHCDSDGYCHDHVPSKGTGPDGKDNECAKAHAYPDRRRQVTARAVLRLGQTTIRLASHARSFHRKMGYSQKSAAELKVPGGQVRGA
ncbi:hypothetical protein JCM12107_19600 [Corynebacterium simulans]